MDVFRVPDSLNELPVSELDVSVRCVNTLMRGGVKTLGDLHGLVPSELLQIRNFGESSLVELQEAYLNLVPDVSKQSPPSLVSPSRDLRRIEEIPLTDLQLEPQIQSTLEDARLHTIGDLLRYGLLLAWRDLKLTPEDLVDIDRKLIRQDVVERNRAEAQKPEPRVLLADRMVESAGRPINLIRQLPELARETAQQLWSVRNYDVLRRRYGLESSEVYKLAEIGSYYDFSRERARQLEARLFKALRSILTGSDDDLAIVAPDAILDEYRELRELVASSLSLVFPKDSARSLLSQRYSVPKKALVDQNGSLTLLLELMGFERLPDSKLPISLDGESLWMAPTANFGVDLLADVIYSIRNALTNSITSLSRFKLTVAVNSNHENRVSPELVDLGIALMPEVMAVDDERVELAISSLRSYADQAFRILRAEGAPLHFREIAREINRRHALIGERPPISDYYRSLSGRLSGDERFVPLGRSGMWALSEWDDVRTEPIADLIHELLASCQEPLDPSEITERLREHRPGLKQGTVVSLVGLNGERFMRVEDGKVALVSWGLEPSESHSDRLSSEEVFETLQSVTLQLIGQRPTKTIPLADLIGALREEGGLSDSTARTRIQRASWAQIHGPTHDQKVTIDAQLLAAVEDGGRSSPVTESIQELVRDYLLQQENGRSPLASVCDHVLSNNHAKRPTIYRAVDLMEDVVKEDVGNTRFCVLQKK